MKHSPWHRHPGVKTGEELSRGERAADHMRNVMGSWPFVFCFIATMVAWALLNTIFLGKVLHHKAFDPYPYILLNLFLSMLAGLQGAILLIAAKRADAVAAQQALHHLSVSESMAKGLGQNTALTKAVKEDTVLLKEIHEHVTALTKAAGLEAGHFEPDKEPVKPAPRKRSPRTKQ